ncbi:MAG TPA: OmpA family protein [Gammaproteobacteria bacterium]|nr:OmpA family protein [Gammaproteobacteria bacterium]
MTRPIMFLCCLSLMCMALSPAFATQPAAIQSITAPPVTDVDHNLQEMLPTTRNANQITQDLTKEGHAVLYSVLFAENKPGIKPESIPQLVEIAKVMQSNPDLRVFVTIHTDNLGMLDYNLRLSQRRAQAVVAALIMHYGVDGRRLVARGIGQLAPIASNATEAGRSKNSRLEIVEIATPEAYEANINHVQVDGRTRMTAVPPDSHSG